MTASIFAGTRPRKAMSCVVLAMGSELGHIDEIDFRGEDLHFGKLIETPGGGNKHTVALGL